MKHKFFKRDLTIKSKIVVHKNNKTFFFVHHKVNTTLQQNKKIYGCIAEFTGYSCCQAV